MARPEYAPAHTAAPGEPAVRKLMIVTDAWRPQVNGVVRTYEWLGKRLPELGIDVKFITPAGYRTVPMPTYPEIRLSLTTRRAIGKRIEAFAPDVVHIATEGPLGMLARSHCRKVRRVFTTCYHTRYPEYTAARFPVPLTVSYAILRNFHNGAWATMVATPGLQDDLKARGFTRTRLWRRGIDVPLFADAAPAKLDLPRPLFLFVGRLAVEKNLEAFLGLDLPGSKLIVGDGPAREQLQKDYPAAHFAGAKHGAELASIYATADAFVFPSLTDTFGLVMAEALAAGTPVAAYPTAGARAIFGSYDCGVMDDDLKAAAFAALEKSRDVARQAGQQHSMDESVRSFLGIVESAYRERHALPAPIEATAIPRAG